MLVYSKHLPNEASVQDANKLRYPHDLTSGNDVPEVLTVLREDMNKVREF